MAKVKTVKIGRAQTVKEGKDVANLTKKRIFFYLFIVNEYEEKNLEISSGSCCRDSFKVFLRYATNILLADQ